MIRYYNIFLLFVVFCCQPTLASSIILNGLEYPEDLYSEIKIYIKKRSLANALSSYDPTNHNVHEIVLKINSRVKSNKKLYCPVCKIYYPVSAEYSNNLVVDDSVNPSSSICIDRLPLKVSYKLPAECPLCGCIFSKTNFSPEAYMKFYDFWYSIYQDFVRKSNDKWDCMFGDWNGLN